MEAFEIERKFLVKKLPEDLKQYECRQLEQGYLCIEPVVRIRRSDDTYTLTYKGKGLLVREEYNLPLTKEAYEHLKPKADGVLITKKRYKMPYQNYMIELDIFEGELAPLQLAEVEFPTKEEAEAFEAPEWFGEDVTFSGQYQNSSLSRRHIAKE
ncbi:MAG: CYTH domain-containing protein [Lachnospiraceae bacterium]